MDYERLQERLEGLASKTRLAGFHGINMDMQFHEFLQHVKAPKEGRAHLARRAVHDNYYWLGEVLDEIQAEIYSIKEALGWVEEEWDDWGE